MTNLTRWDPFREMQSFRDIMDRMFEDYYPSDVEPGQSRVWGMPLDVVENEDEFVIRATLPGVNPDDIEITYNNNTLTLKGSVKQDEDFKNVRYHIRERRMGTFQRSIYLPTPVKADAIEAHYDAGILTLRLPKTEEVKPRRIPIKAGQSQKMIEGQAVSTGKRK